MHCSLVYSCLSREDCDVLENISTQDWFIMRKMIIEMILATDMAKHFEMIGNLKQR